MIAKVYEKWLKESNKNESKRAWYELKKAQEESKSCDNKQNRPNSNVES
jgi:hypothetical protein